MKAHLFIALGILLMAIFAIRAMDALNTPGISWKELYVLGGFVLSGALIWRGLQARKDFIADQDKREN